MSKVLRILNAVGVSIFWADQPRLGTFGVALRMYRELPHEFGDAAFHEAAA